MNNVDMMVPGNGSYEQKLRRATNWLHRRSEEDMGILRDKQGREMWAEDNELGSAIASLQMAARMQILETPPINQEERLLRQSIKMLDQRQRDERGLDWLDEETRDEYFDMIWELRYRALAGPIPSSYRLLYLYRRSVDDCE